MGELQWVLEIYKDVMVVVVIMLVCFQDNDIFICLMCNDEKDDWLKCGVCSDVVELYCQQDFNVMLVYDYWGLSGIGGYFDLKVYIMMFQVDVFWLDGWVFFCIDMVNMDVGCFFMDEDGKYDNNWGICMLEKCSGYCSQVDMGVSVVVGWQNEIWCWDIGMMLMGFNVVDVVGGVSYSDDIGLLGYILNVYCCLIFSLLLVFGG